MVASLTHCVCIKLEALKDDRLLEPVRIEIDLQLGFKVISININFAAMQHRGISSFIFG